MNTQMTLFTPLSVETAPEFIVACGFGAVHIANGGGNPLGIPLVEGRILQEQRNIRLNPEARGADREKDARGLVASPGVGLS